MDPTMMTVTTTTEEEDYYDLEDGWEDERGEEEYPDEVSESGDEPLDTSWEDSNEYDFEDPEYLRLPPTFVSSIFSCWLTDPNVGLPEFQWCSSRRCRGER